MLNIGYFLLSCGIFALFSILITVLGFCFQHYFFNSFKLQKVSLTLLLESFAVGIALFIIYSYIIIDFLRIFNFFTIYLPLVIFDCVSLFLIFYKKNYLCKEEINAFFKKFHQFFSNKRVKSHFVILIVIFCLLFIVQGVIEMYLSLPSKDPYTWLSITLYLQKYGDLNYSDYTAHGVGFVVFTAGSLLITGDFYLQYFFIKYIPIFFFVIVIISIYNIASKIFNKNIEILLILTTLLSFNSLMYRFTLAVPSIIATTLSMIFINTLIQQENSRIYIIRGIILGGIFLTHPLYFLYLFLFIFIFDLLILFMQYKNNLKIREIKNSLIFLNFLKKYGLFLSIIILFTIPYFINLYISDKSLYKNFTRYLFRGYQANLHGLFDISSMVLSINETILLSLNPSKTDLFYNLIFFGLNIPINKTLNWGTIFIILGLFYKPKEVGSLQKYLINFIKITFILTFMIFIINSFLFLIDNNTVLSLASFINQYGTRLIELYSPIWAFLFIFGVMWIFEFLKNNKIKKIQGYTVTKLEKIGKIDLVFEKYYIFTLIILGTLIYSSHLYVHYTIYYENHYEDDDLTEALLFMGDYFNKKNLEDQTVILPENIDSTIFQLIYHKDFEKEYFEYDHTNYTTLMNEIEDENADFVLVYKIETKNSCLEEIDDEQKVLYENPHYLFFKVK